MEAETKEETKIIAERQRGRMSGVKREAGLCFSKYQPTNSTVRLSSPPLHISPLSVLMCTNAASLL